MAKIVNWSDADGTGTIMLPDGRSALVTNRDIRPVPTLDMITQREVMVGSLTVNDDRVLIARDVRFVSNLFLPRASDPAEVIGQLMFWRLSKHWPPRIEADDRKGKDVRVRSFDPDQARSLGCPQGILNLLDDWLWALGNSPEYRNYDTWDWGHIVRPSGVAYYLDKRPEAPRFGPGLCVQTHHGFLDVVGSRYALLVDPMIGAKVANNGLPHEYCLDTEATHPTMTVRKGKTLLVFPPTWGYVLMMAPGLKATVRTVACFMQATPSAFLWSAPCGQNAELELSWQVHGKHGMRVQQWHGTVSMCEHTVAAEAVLP